MKKSKNILVWYKSNIIMRENGSIWVLMNVVSGVRQELDLSFTIAIDFKNSINKNKKKSIFYIL